MEPAGTSRYFLPVTADSDQRAQVPETTSVSANDTVTAAMTVQPAASRWWNTLRVRFGLLLALALLPWLIFTALEAVRSASQTRASESLQRDLLSTNTVSEVALLLEAGRFGLEAAPEMVREFGCADGGERLLTRLDAFEAFVVQSADGTVSCQHPDSLESLQLIGASDFINDFRVELGRIDRGAGEGVREVVLLQTRVPRTGDIYTLVLPTTLGLRQVLDVALGEAAMIALTKPGGGVILGRPITPEQTAMLAERMKPNEISLIDMKGAEGQDRRIATTFVEDLGIYVTVGRDAGEERSLIFNDTTAVLLPILAWIIGFALIWLGTQTMLITPLARMRAAARQYAGGELQRRVTLSDSAAGEVRGLAQTFNRMASELQDRDERIADNMDEKDTLLREIHHRVKNNLQIIISLLNMQERKATSAEAIAAITETRSRINAIATVHRGLYESPDLRSIDMEVFLSRLLSSLAESLSLEDRDIRLSHHVDALKVTADSAIPLALFIVEALGNAAEHGLERGGSVVVDIAADPGADTLSVGVSDTGRGVGDPSKMSGVGTRLMRGFARQLGAELVFADNQPGLSASLVVPLSQVTDCGDEPFQVRRADRG